jgi:lactate 2-monooxygenase
MAPVGVQTIFHKDREVGLAKACAEIGVPYIMSTAASSSIEEVAEASGLGHRFAPPSPFEEPPH